MTEIIRAPALPSPYVDRRIDLGTLKDRLQRVLGDKSAAYWQVLRKFIQAKLTKHEFDEFARVSLGPRHLYLHNTFILSIISNAHCTIPPNVVHGQGGSLQIRHARAVEHGKPSPGGKSRRYKPERPAIDSPSHVQRMRVRGMQQKPRYSMPSLASDTDDVPQSSNGVIRLQNTAASGRTAIAGRLLEEELELLGAPQLLALRRKMIQVAESAAVPRVSNDAVRFMMNALQHHLREVMSSCCPYIGPPAGNRVGNTVVVTARDVVAALEVNPSVLGEDLAINRERALLTLDSRSNFSPS
eukprot:CAMPEP_0114637114 /NCGR_PEP_ID=MMETSP0168-20121206/17327_1 /TAXON_ID=95228 ORGANISM="Vannella sp., Strain DIVA3 517/6/12" /NCGR_SAMPLE_ID=MMETSP0168 /ASSEMBLY_ACC=CAM_ASM_000044 /LENGTH=298 /DNA_ID=CAMNT_0001848833 /DNA_START=101 /DNA_END=993 /DNA_ORIENTATION=-